MPPDDPAAPRPQPAPQIANQGRLEALGRAIERKPAAPTSRSRRRRQRSRSTRWMLRGGIAFASIVVLLVVALFALYLYFGALDHKTKVNGLQDPTASSENILLVGSTNRCAPGMKANPAYGLCSDGVTGVNSDIVMIVHLNPNTHAVSLLSVPRDLFVPNAREDGANKIDAALVEGPSQLTAAIEEDFGIPIDHFVELNFDTFANVVGNIGGIDMYFPMRVYDAESGLNIEHPGCYHLDGIHALQVVRARHLQIGWYRAGTFVAPAATGTSAPYDFTNDPREWPQEAQSDLARIRRTHEFLRIVAAKISSLGISDVVRDYNLAKAVLPNLTVDDNFSEGHMIDLATTYAGISIANVAQLTYPVVENYADPQDAYDYIYQGYNYGEVEFPIQPGGWQTVDQIFAAKDWTSPWNDKNLPKPDGFHLSVENATGISGKQTTVATELEHKGYDVTRTGTRTPVGTTSETVIWYGGPPPPKSGDWKSASQAAAIRVLTTLEGPVTLGYDPAMVTPGDMVTVQIGSDLYVATKDWTAIPTTTTTIASSSSTSSTMKVTTTTSASTATTVPDPPGINHDNNFSHPSDTAQPLQPWDPRACPAGVKVVNDTSGE